MDLSKLPKFSETPQPPSNDAADASPAPAPRDPTTTVDPGIGAEVWISAILGVIFMLLGRQFASYLLATMSGRNYETGVNWVQGPNAGQPVHYFDLEGGIAWTESGLFLFGVALVLEAIILLAVYRSWSYKRVLLMVALALSIVATLQNIVVAAVLFQKNIMPIMTLLAVAVGGYIAAYEWRLLKTIR